jgi:hypothetical protein
MTTGKNLGFDSSKESVVKGTSPTVDHHIELSLRSHESIRHVLRHQTMGIQLTHSE